MRFRAHLLLPLTCLALTAGCGGGGDAPGGKGARDGLSDLKPVDSARLSARLRLGLDNAPAEVGKTVTLTIDGPLRANGPRKLPSLDWKIGFDGFGERFGTRLVSTGNNVFVRLAGADFEVGEANIARVNEEASRSPAGGDGLAALGLDPLKAVKRVKKGGRVTVGGVSTTRYVGTVDRNRVLDQVQAFLRTAPVRQQSLGGQPVPQVQLTPERRRQVGQTFREPSFEVDVADDRTVRRLIVNTRFVTPEANRQAAGGITGGTIEYRAEYSEVGAAFRFVPVRRASPIGEFSAALQRQLSK